MTSISYLVNQNFVNGILLVSLPEKDHDVINDVIDDVIKMIPKMQSNSK